MNPWIYDRKPMTSIEDFPEDVVGFVYLIVNNITGKFYIGKKILHMSRKKRLSAKRKKELGTRKVFENIKKESDWKIYHGSSDSLREDIQKYGAENFARNILELCCTKKYLSYAEISWQMKLEVLKKDSYNGNILGRYFKKDLQNCY